MRNRFSTVAILLWIATVVSCAAMPGEDCPSATNIGTHADVTITADDVRVIRVGFDAPVRRYDMPDGLSSPTLYVVQLSRPGAVEGDVWRFNVKLGVSPEVQRFEISDGEGAAAPRVVQVQASPGEVARWFVLMYFDGAKWSPLDIHRQQSN